MIHKIKDENIERSLLGTIIQHPNCLIDICDIITGDDFYNDKSTEIYNLCWRIYKEETDIDHINIMRINDLCKDDIVVYLTSIEAEGDMPYNAVKFAKIIKDKSIKRKLYEYTLKLQEDFKKEKDIEPIITKAQSELLEIIVKTTDKKNTNVKSISERLIESIGKTADNKGLGLKIGMPALTNCIGGYIPGHLWIIGAWTSTGKSTLVYELIKRIYEANLDPKVLVFSTEMTDEGNILKLLSNLTGTPPLSILKGYNASSVVAEMAKISRYELDIIDNLYRWEDIYIRAKKQKILKGVDVIFIDFLQNIIGEGTIYDRMSKLAPKMQELAKEIDCTIVAMSQLANEDAAGGDMLKFKGAGELSAACDLGIILQRNKGEGGLPNDEVNMIVKKNRWGATGKTELKFVNTYTAMQECRHDKTEY